MGMALYVPRYTVAELDQFPDDGNRYELLSGTLIVTPAPKSGHQGVIARLAALFAKQVLAGTVGLFAPGVVKVSFDTQLEPDLLLTTPAFTPGMPWEQCEDHWLAVEAFSPSSRVYDREHECATYLRHGVRQVWLIDIEAKTIETFTNHNSSRLVRDALNWQSPDKSILVRVNLAQIFRGID